MARHGRHGAPRAAVRAPSAPATAPFGFSRNTRHESRLFLRGCARGGVTRNRRLDHCPRRQVAVFQFTIVHYCSLLFAIVHQKYCPAPVPSCRPVAAFVRVVARHGRPWRGRGGILPPRQRPCPVRRSRWPRGERRSPQLSSPSGLMRQWSTRTCLRPRLCSRGMPPPAGGLRSAAGWDERRSLSPQAGPELLADSTHGAGRARQLGCGRRAGFFTMLTRRREPRRQEQPRKSRTLFQDSP